MPPSGKWRDVASYEYLMHADGEQIAWEFLRRKNNYKKAYAAYSLDDTKSENKPYHFSLRKFLDPDIAKIPAGDKGQLFRTPAVKVYAADIRATKYTFMQKGELHKPSQVLLRFDLSRSIPLQLKSAKDELKTQLQLLKNAGVVVGVRQRLEDRHFYIRRLRIIDAKNAGATDADIIEQFSKDSPIGPTSRYEASNLRSDKKAINEMRKDGYRTLAHVKGAQRRKRAVTVQLADHASTKTIL